MSVHLLGINQALDRMVLGWLAEKARQSVPRGDELAAESAFCSEVAANEYAHLFPFLVPKGGSR